MDICEVVGMENFFNIEVEVEDSERKVYLEKLCNLFMQKGFIIERESENDIELSRPLSGSSKDETIMYPWIDKVCIQGTSSGFVVNCSVKNYRLVRYLTIYALPVVDVIIIVILFSVVKEHKMLFPFIFILIFSYFFINFIFNMQFKNMINTLAKEIQNLS